MFLNWLADEFLIHFWGFVCFFFHFWTMRFMSICLHTSVQISKRNPISYRRFSLFFLSKSPKGSHNLRCIGTSEHRCQLNQQSTTCFFAVQFALMSHIFGNFWLWPILKIIATSIHCWVHENIMDIYGIGTGSSQKCIVKKSRTMFLSFDNSLAFFRFILMMLSCQSIYLDSIFVKAQLIRLKNESKAENPVQCETEYKKNEKNIVT